MSRQAVHSVLGHPILLMLSLLINCASCSLILSAVHFYTPLLSFDSLFCSRIPKIYFHFPHFAFFVLWILLKGKKLLH